MAVWETEDEYSAPIGASLPTPNDTPYRTPSRNSRKSRRSVTPPGKSSSPAPDKGDKSSKRSSRDVTTDETISILDPRRFTPTLHANLVSEILALRRDQEEKLKLIESLESSLHTTREEQESLQATLLGTAKESRSLKRQLALLEGGTSSALGELARERDEAVDTVNETKKRLDVLQKKVRSQEEDSERVHDQWAKDKDAWEEEKRKYERKVHVAESRLKVVLDEVAAFQAAHTNGVHGHQHGAESEAEEPGKDNDAASVRTMSMTNSIRFSFLNGPGAIKANGHSLADELNFDGDEDYETDPGGRDSVLSHNNVHGRNPSRDSIMPKSIHRRNQSNESLTRPGSVARGRFFLNQFDRIEDGIIREDDETQPPPAKFVYTDTGVQYSPPPSPKLAPVKPSTPEPPVPPLRALERIHEVESPPRAEWEVEANQRRKRVQISRPLTIEPATSMLNKMVNGSSQTSDEPLSPPKTPKSPYQDALPSPVIKPPTIMVSSSTQTDYAQLHSFLPLPPMPIPSISIHPPTSRPTTPREPRLPQLFKDFGCQVSLTSVVPSKSIAVQTEEIRIDRRLDRLPAHLHPSAVTSRPASPAAPEATPDDARNFTPVPGTLPPRNPRRLATKRSFTDPGSSPPSSSAILAETHDAYPGNNDDGPLSNQRAPMRRPHRISSLFAGFEGGSSDEADEFADADMSDTEYRTALSAPSKPKAGVAKPHKRSSGGTASASTSTDLPSRINGARSSMRPLGGGPEVYSTFTLPEGREAPELVAAGGSAGKSLLKGMSRAFEKSSLAGSSNRSSVIRKAAMIQSGIATHQNRSRSPSLPDPREPPFPIPTRASSRKPPISASAPSDGQRSPTRAGDSWHRRGIGRSHFRANSIRKVRSAAALPVKSNPRYRRNGSRSPPPPFSPTDVPPSPSLPPMPTNDITTPRNRGDTGTGVARITRANHQPQLSTNTANTGDTGFASVDAASQATGVVDAIAQAMVGEWMFKYVRRRKSFGVAETNGRDDNSNDRHKRWVWLAPYERAILWSSKQPVSGSALMGKSGRKLTIQSVLDVKDDNPPPKGVSQLFNRSILILTPQRALKFTAANAERHYAWLTALSFLAHSSQAVPDIVAAPPPKPIPDFELPRPKAKRPGIRDSIRLAKVKTGGGATAARPSLPPSVVSGSTAGDNRPPSIPSLPPSLANFRPGESSTSAPSTAAHHNNSAYHNHTNGTHNNHTHTREQSGEAAQGPHIPRFHERANNVVLHGRKRSNTGGHVPPPLSFRGFSGPAGSGSGYHHAATNSTAGNSVGTAGSSDIYVQSQGSSAGITWGTGTGSQRTSEASSRPPLNNFFDAIGTVRMEAFISPLAFSRFDGGLPDDHQLHHDEIRQLVRRRSKELRRRASRSRHDSRNRDSYVSRGTRGTDEYYAGSRTEGEGEYYFREDPFKGF